MEYDKDQDQQAGQVNLKMPDDVIKGTYSNFVVITHTPNEFIFDFANVLPPQSQVNARIILSPPHAKRFLGALQDNIRQYEEANGEIQEPSPSTPQSSPTFVN